MTHLVQAGGVELAVTVRGEGPLALFVHGIGADARTHEPTLERLAMRRRVVAYDRRGYGDSGAPVPYEGTTVEEQAQDAAAVLRSAGGGPALLIGEGFGALVCLDLVRRHRALCAAAVLREPPLLAFVPEATEALARARVMLEERLREEGPEAAVEAWLGDTLAGDDLARARTAFRAFFADLAGLPSWPVTRRELRAIDVPLAVVTGPASPPYLVAAADALAGLVPGAARRHDGDLVAAAGEL